MQDGSLDSVLTIIYDIQASYSGIMVAGSGVSKTPPVRGKSVVSVHASRLKIGKTLARLHHQQSPRWAAQAVADGRHNGVDGARLLGPHLAAATPTAFAFAAFPRERAVRHHVPRPPAVPTDLPVGVMGEHAGVCCIIAFLSAVLSFESPLPGAKR